MADSLGVVKGLYGNKQNTSEIYGVSNENHSSCVCVVSFASLPVLIWSHLEASVNFSCLAPRVMSSVPSDTDDAGIALERVCDLRRQQKFSLFRSLFISLWGKINSANDSRIVSLIGPVSRKFRKLFGTGKLFYVCGVCSKF